MSRAGQQCGAAELESGDDDDDAPLRVRLRAAFAELIDDPAGLIGDMAPCGPRASTQGDAIIGLPTLVHRGPGTVGLAAGAAGRCVCFFTIRPKFRGERAALNHLGTYDADSQACCPSRSTPPPPPPAQRVCCPSVLPSVLRCVWQVHGAWLLWRLDGLVDPASRRQVLRAYAQQGYPLADYGIAEEPERPHRPRGRRCGACAGCTGVDCGTCANCKDKRKFGGPGKRRRACAGKACTQPR